MKGLIIYFQIKNAAMLERNSIPQDELKKKIQRGEGLMGASSHGGESSRTPKTFGKDAVIN